MTCGAPREFGCGTQRAEARRALEATLHVADRCPTLSADARMVARTWGPKGPLEAARRRPWDQTRKRHLNRLGPGGVRRPRGED